MLVNVLIYDELLEIPGKDRRYGYVSRVLYLRNRMRQHNEVKSDVLNLIWSRFAYRVSRVVVVVTLELVLVERLRFVERFLLRLILSKEMRITLFPFR